MTKKFGLRNWFSTGFSDQRTPKSNKLVKSKKDKPEKEVDLFPKLADGEHHPLPYYRAEEVTFEAVLHPPWKDDDDKEARRRKEAFLMDPKLHQMFLEALLEETVREEVMSISSSELSGQQNKKSRDQLGIVFSDEEILMPVIKSEVFLCCWELLFQCGRDLSTDELNELRKWEKNLKMDESDREKLTQFTLSDSPSGIHHQLSQHRWQQLVFNYRLQLEETAYADSFAMVFVQHRLVSQLGTQQVAGDTLVLLEKDMRSMDEVERISDPPRQG